MKRSHHASAQPVAVFDISSSSVAGAHVLVHTEKDDSVILAQSRIDSPLQQTITMSRFLDNTVKSLGEVISSIQKADHHHPEYIQLVLASPWYVSQTRAIKYKREAPFACTQKLIDSLIQQEVEYMLAHDMEQFGSFGKEAVIVEKQISMLKLNGYPTDKPFGKKATSLDLFLTVTIAPKVIVERFTEVVRKSYGSRKIGITTSAYSTFIAARDHFNVNDEVVVIDVGEEITDVAFVKNGLFMYQHSFPVGTYELYRLVEEHSKHTAEEAKALLEAYRLGKVSTAAKKSIDGAMMAFAKTWQEALQKILDEGHFGFCLPEQCFIMADPRFEQVFTEIVETDPYIQHTCSRGIVQPIFLTAELVKQKIRTIDLLEPDVPLAAASLFVERMM